MSEFQVQAPICPFCFDDHLMIVECDKSELKKIIIKAEFRKLISDYVPKNEKHDCDLEKRFERMIDWL